MVKDTPRKIIHDISKILRLHKSLGFESYPKSDEIQSFLDIALEETGQGQKGSVPVALREKKAGQAEKTLSHKTLADIKAELGDCTRCALHKDRTRILFGDGPSDARLIIIGEWPNRLDDAEGVLFSNKEGELLLKMLRAIGVDLKDVYLTNTLKCRASEGNPPGKEHTSVCRPFLLSQIDVISPKVIVTMGPIAAQVMLSTNKLLVHLRGRIYRYKKIPLIPTFHPSYLLKTPEMKKAAWIDLQLAQRELAE